MIARGNDAVDRGREAFDRSRPAGESIGSTGAGSYGAGKVVAMTTTASCSGVCIINWARNPGHEPP